MTKDLYLAIFELVMDHYIESCFEVPIYVKINVTDFDVDKFNVEDVHIPNGLFDHIELESFKENPDSFYSNDITIVMRNHPILNTSKVLKA